MSDKKLRIAFMGTPGFALPALEALCNSDHDVVCVYTRAPKAKGRGQKTQNSPVHDYALAREIPVFHPSSLKKPEAQDIFKSHQLDLAVVVAYGLLLPKAVLQAPTYGCINIHASLLPRWRGASPIQYAILKGDAESGITLMQMDEGLDTGAMIVKSAVPIDEHTTTPVLHDRLAVLGGALILEAVQKLAAQGVLPAEPQNDKDATHAPLLTKEDGRVQWSSQAAAIGRQVRALNPWPGAWSDAGGKRFKILEAYPSPQAAAGNPGLILNTEGDIICGAGTVLRIQKLQPENGRAMDFTAAVNGGYLKMREFFT